MTVEVVRCSFVCVGWVRCRCSNSSRFRHQKRSRVALAMGRRRWVEVDIDSIFGAAVAVKEVAGMLCWAVVAEVLLRRYTRLDSGRLVMVAEVAGMDRVRRMIAAVLLAGRTEGMAAVIVKDSRVVGGRRGLQERHWNSSSRCLGMRVHRRRSEGRHLTQGGACRT